MTGCGQLFFSCVNNSLVQLALSKSLIALMGARGLNASETGFLVGYTNPSQFSREFKRLFGFPPGQLVKAISSPEYPGGNEMSRNLFNDNQPQCVKNSRSPEEAGFLVR